MVAEWKEGGCSLESPLHRLISLTHLAAQAKPSVRLYLRLSFALSSWRNDSNIYSSTARVHYFAVIIDSAVLPMFPFLRYYSILLSSFITLFFVFNSSIHSLFLRYFLFLPPNLLFTHVLSTLSFMIYFLVLLFWFIHPFYSSSVLSFLISFFHLLFFCFPIFYSLFLPFVIINSIFRFFFIFSHSFLFPFTFLSCFNHVLLLSFFLHSLLFSPCLYHSPCFYKSFLLFPSFFYRFVYSSFIIQFFLFFIFSFHLTSLILVFPSLFHLFLSSMLLLLICFKINTFIKLLQFIARVAFYWHIIIS